MSSLKNNVIYSSILTVSGYLFPLITFPYVTRVLGVNNIGICNFADSIIQYFIYFSMMGLTTIGIREIARSKGNIQKLSKTFSDLFLLNIIATIVAIIGLIICILFVPQLQEHKTLFYIGIAKILANTLLVEWLYKGMEDFKYITIRAVIIKSLYVVLVFCLVKDSNDYIMYFALTALMIVVNAIVNLGYSIKFVRLTLCKVNMRPFIKPFFTLGIYMLLTSFYTTFNVAFLGFITNSIEVGYYTTATKLYTIIMSLFTAFTGVMLPRMSTMLSTGDLSGFNKLAFKSINILLSFALPTIILTEFCAPEIVSMIAGPGFDGAIFPMRIVMPLMLIIGLEQIFVIQILTPLKKDFEILINSILGAFIAIILNLILVKDLGAVGSSIVWFSCETAVLFMSQNYTRRYAKIGIPCKIMIKETIWYIPLLLLLFMIYVSMDCNIFHLILSSFVVAVYTYVLQIKIFKNTIFVSILDKLKSKLFL